MSAILPIPGLLLTQGSLDGSTTPALGAPTAPAGSAGSTASGVAPSSSTTGLVGGPAATPAKKSSGSQSLSDIFRPARIATFVLGVLLIAAGLFSLKPVREAVTRTARTARRAGEAVA